MEYKGIDISVHQGKVDFEQVKKSGIDFVMIRTGYGKNASQYDKKLAENVAGAEAAGLHYGFYHYSYATTTAGAAAEAGFALSLVKDYHPTMPFCYDMEDASQAALKPAEMSAIADTFLAKVKDAGYYPMLYANLSWLRTKFTPELLSKYDVWLAQWAKAPTYTGTYGMWQHSDSGSVAGINGAVDLDVAYKDYPTLIAEMKQAAIVLDNTPSDYAKDAVDKALALGILKGGTEEKIDNLMLHSALTRQDFFVLMDRLHLLG